MIALVLFVVLMFAPLVGLEPGFIDDEASRVVLEPKRFFVVATLVGLIVDIVFFRSRYRTERSDRIRGWIGAMGSYYVATLVCAVLARGALSAPALYRVPVARFGILTWEAWVLLIGTFLIVSVGGVALGAFFYARLADVQTATRQRLATGGVMSRSGARALGGFDAHATVSMFVTAGILSGGVVAAVLAAAHWPG